MGIKSDGVASGTAESASSDRGDSTRVQNLHALDTALLPAARGWPDEQTDTDETRVDARGEIPAKKVRSLESSSPPAMESASNPDPTIATRLVAGTRSLVPGTLVGEFVIERLLGAGGMGQVYGGHHERMGRRVAVKVIAPKLSRDRAAIERFEQEALALACLSHPNIVGVLSVGMLPGDGRSYYVMEWLDGESLQARLNRGRLDLDDALDVLDQVARGLEAAHASGIVHRDLKPDNVWLQRVASEARPVVKILDFGLAKLAQHRRSEDTATGVWIGTPQFLSPEQCQSARAVEPATDVYALGCTAYELLCGRLPFDYDNVAELIAAHRTEVPPRPRDMDPTVDRDLDELLYVTLAKDPVRRPTLAAFRAIVASVRMRRAGFSRSTRAATPTMVVHVPPVPVPQRRWVMAVTAFMLLLAGVTLAAVVRLIAASVTRGGGADLSAPRVALPGDAARAERAETPAPMDASAVLAESLVDAAASLRPPREAPRAAVPSIHNVPSDQPDAGNVGATVPGVVDAGELDERPRELPAPKVHEPPLPRPTAPPTPRPDKNQTYNPFTGRPASR